MCQSASIRSDRGCGQGCVGDASRRAGDALHRVCHRNRDLRDAPDTERVYCSLLSTTTRGLLARPCDMKTIALSSWNAQDSSLSAGGAQSLRVEFLSKQQYAAGPRGPAIPTSRVMMSAAFPSRRPRPAAADEDNALRCVTVLVHHHPLITFRSIVPSSTVSLPSIVIAHASLRCDSGTTFGVAIAGFS